MMRVVQFQNPDIKPGEIRMMCVHCQKLGESFPLPSGRKLPTPDDVAASIEHYRAIGWVADADGPKCLNCQRSGSDVGHA